MLTRIFYFILYSLAPSISSELNKYKKPPAAREPRLSRSLRVPGPFPPIVREPRLSCFLRFPGPFPPIAREPRPSRFLRFPGPFPPIAREPRPSRSLSPPFHPPFPPTGAGRASSVQVRPEIQKSQQSPGPTGTTVSTSRALLRHPPGALLQVTDTVPERFRRHQVPTPLSVHSVNKGPLVATPVCFTTPFPRPDSRPPDTVRSAKATPAVWRPTTAAKRDWRSRHTATDPNGVKSRDVTAASERHSVSRPKSPSFSSESGFSSRGATET
jgi:hypothetical protein